MSNERIGFYEGMFLFPQSATANLQGAVDHIKGILDKAGATIKSFRKWDDRRLAYEINGNKRGVYFLAYFNAPVSSLSDLERMCNQSEEVLRMMVTKADHIPTEVIESNEGSEELVIEIKRRSEQTSEASAKTSSKISKKDSSESKSEKPAKEVALEATKETAKVSDLKVTEKPAEEVTEKSTQEVTEKPAEEVTEKPAEEVTNKAVPEPAEEVAEEAAPETTEEPAEDAKADTSDEDNASAVATDEDTATAVATDEDTATAEEVTEETKEEPTEA